MSLLPFEKIKRAILIRKDLDSSKKFGFDIDKRPIQMMFDRGIVNVDKPQGPTSHQVSAYVKQILHINKTGHSGTLDPNVTGILPTALGKSTKIAQALLSAGKEYVCIMHIHQDIKEQKIRDVCNSFLGTITQLPPLKSAVKRQERDRDIYYLDILEIDGREVLFKVGCQGGTYIRKLCHDIGERLGCGAHMAELRRTKAGPFDESTLTRLQQLQDAYITWKEEGKEDALRKCILPVEYGVKHLPKVWVTEYTVDSLCHGAALKIPGIAKIDDGVREKDVVAIMTLRGELIALGNAKLTTKEIMRKEKGIAILVDSVFMDPGTYPKMVTKD